MLFIRPPWVNHGNKDRRDKGSEVQIYAIDIHPDGTKVATGGEGDLGGRICIWNMKPILKDCAEKNEGIQKLLTKIDSHEQSVHTLRWSNSGECFASAGGDKLVMIWSSIGDNKYKSIATLRSHSLDVMDLAWSPNDEFLATASIDNSIVIWNAQQWPEIVKILQKHDNFVKGVSWDPIGKYLASQSDDKTLRVWRVSDWSEEVSIKEPFEDSNTSSTVTRIDWSPNGQFLVSAQAMNNDGFVSKIIERNNWTYNKDFVGHRKNVCCVAFSPHIFKQFSTKKDSDGVKFKPQCVLAIGSRDRSISIWGTSKTRPIVVLNDIFENTVMDLSWSPCGYRLMACSLDGSVVLLEFSKEELGKIFSFEEKQLHLQEFYGKSFANKAVRDTLIEDVNIILAQNNLKDNVQTNGTVKAKEESTKVNGIVKIKKEMENAQNAKSVLESVIEEVNEDVVSQKDESDEEDKSDKSKPVSNGGKQVEIRQADGKKRIMTLLKPKNQNIGIETNSTSSVSKTKIIIETYDEKNLPKEVKDKFLTPSANGDESVGESSDSEAEIRCKKKRKLIREASSDEESIILRRKPKKDVRDNDEDDDEDDDYIENRRRKEKKRKQFSRLQEFSRDDGDSQIVGMNEESQQSQSLLRHRKHKSKPVSITRIRPQVHVFTSEKLTKQTHQNLKLFGDADGFTCATIEYPSHASQLVKLTVVENDQVRWSTVLSSAIIFISGNSQVIVAVCEDMTLNTFSSSTGARINSAFVIEADIAKIMFGETKSHVCVLTCEGRLWIWDVVSPKLIIKGITMIPILIDPKNNDKLSITKLSVDKTNVVISVSNGKTFQYEKTLKAWCLLKNSHDPLAVSANYKGPRIDGFRKEILNTPSHKLLNLFSANTSLGQLSLISFIEQQIFRTKLIKNYEEFIFWTKMLVQNLTQMHSSGFNVENVEVRLRDLCSSLLGTSFPKIVLHTEPSSNQADDKFLGDEQSRKRLLDDLLKIIASQTSLQRLYLEFKEQSDFFNTEPMMLT